MARRPLGRRRDGAAAGSDHRPDRHGGRPGPARSDRGRGAAARQGRRRRQARLRDPRPARRDRASGGRDRPVLVGHVLRALRGALRRQGRRARPVRPDRPGRSRPWVWVRTGRSTARTWPAARDGPTGSTTPPAPAASSPTSPATRSISSCWFTGSDTGGGGVQHRGQLHPPGIAHDAGLRRGHAAQRRRPWLRPGRLVHAAGTADLGRRSARHPRHRGLHRAAQVRRHRGPPRSRPPVRRRRSRHRVRRLLRRRAQLLPGPGARHRRPHRDRVSAGAHLRGDATGPAGSTGRARAGSR